ncbi:MAG: DEAD/DEAH box helicase [Methanosarcinaceae archaeon]|nr:DEAD/DEAH box helicase [Methanosarcinaceae archaeon]
MTEYVNHPLIRPDTVEQRLYQLDLAGKALSTSTLVVLPTGLGKTIVALLIIASRLETIGGKILILAPTKPLVEQHAAFLRKVLLIPEDKILTLTGTVRPADREALWKEGTIIISTPQVIENDLLTKRISLEDVSHITFDESHRTVGNYAYTYIAERYPMEAKHPLCLGITASPGSSDEKINEICENLHIRSIAVKTESDGDVAPYIHDKKIEWKHVRLPDELKELKGLLDKILDDRFKKLSDLGYSVPYQKNASKMDLLSLQKKLQSQLRGGQPDPGVYSALSIMAEILKVNHAVEVTETQGLDALTKYIDRLENEAYSRNASKASKRLADDMYIRQLSHRIKECSMEHPKIEAVLQIVSEEIEQNSDSRVIVFTNYRDTAEVVTTTLSEVAGLRPVKFVGQSSRYRDKGLTQKQQVDIIDRFKKGEYNVLVATSVAEEGLDIPSTNLVIFYEPIPSEIRSIQRKGRTGRKQEGRVVVLITKGTRDEGYYWSSTRREKQMQSNIRLMQDSLPYQDIEDEAASEMLDGSTGEMVDKIGASTDKKSKQKALVDFNTEDLTVVVDQREIRSTVVRSLEKLGMNISVRTLEVGDYVVSDRLAIERKSAEDLAGSLIDGKLFDQISNLARTYSKAVLILEGEGVFGARQLGPNAIHGTLASIALDFGVSILYTRDTEDTASLIRLLAKREQTTEKREIKVHGKKSSQTLSQQQEYIVSAIPEIGPKAARNLLVHFGSIEAIMEADTKQLTQVTLIGPKTAARIREIVSSTYKG